MENQGFRQNWLVRSLQGCDLYLWTRQGLCYKLLGFRFLKWLVLLGRTHRSARARQSRETMLITEA